VGPGRARLTRRGGLVLGLAAWLAGLALAEALVRLAFPQPLRPAWDDVLSGVRVPRPGLTGRHTMPGAFAVTVSINGQRFRARHEISPAAEPGVLRVAVLGDSLAFGWGAEDVETYPARLEELLAERLAPARFEVLNAAFPGTCMGEKVRWYEVGVRPFHPKVVVLSALGDDVDGDLYWRVFSLDAQGVAQPAPAARVDADAGVRGARALFEHLPGRELLAERSQLFALVRRAATRLVSSERTSALGARPATPEEMARFRGDGLPLLQAELRRLQQDVSADGARLIVVFLPFRDSVYATTGWWADELRGKSQEVSRALAAVCAELRVPFKDVTAELVAQARRSGPALYHEGTETHPTPLGYRAIAESVAPLVAEGLP